MMMAKQVKSDHRRHVHLQGRAHGNEGDRHTGERPQQRGARRDLAHDRRDEAADHQNEALKEHPDQAGFPALDRIIGGQRDRQHDHEGHDEHVRHADARRQRANIATPGLLRQAVGQKGVVEGRQAQHEAERRQDAAEHDRVRHLDHKTQQAGKHQHVDQNVGAETEEGIEIAGGPYFWTESGCRCCHGHCTLPSVANPEEAGGDTQALTRAQFDGPRICELENPRLPAAIVAIVNDCVLKTRKARANRSRVVRRRGAGRQSRQTMAKSEYGSASRPPHPEARQARPVRSGRPAIK